MCGLAANELVVECNSGVESELVVVRDDEAENGGNGDRDSRPWRLSSPVKRDGRDILSGGLKGKKLYYR